MVVSEKEDAGTAAGIAFAAGDCGAVYKMETGMKRMDKNALAQTACQDLLTYGVWDTKKWTKHWIKKYLLGRKEAPEDLIFWPTGLLAAGLWQCRQERRAADKGAATETTADTEQIERALMNYYERWIKKGCRITWLDDLLAGETLLELYESQDFFSGQDQEKCRQAIEKLAVYALEYPTDETGSFPYRAAQDKIGRAHV